MSSRQLLGSLLVFVTLTVCSFGQKLTPAQLAYLNEIYAKSGDGAVPGTWLTPGTVPLNRLVESVLTSETDPVFNVWQASGVSLTKTEAASTYLSSVSAASTYATIASLSAYATLSQLSGYAPLAHPVFEGHWAQVTNNIYDSATNWVTCVTNTYWVK